MVHFMCAIVAWPVGSYVLPVFFIRIVAFDTLNEFLDANTVLTTYPGKVNSKIDGKLLDSICQRVLVG